jgi:hypothetical protein
VRNELFLREETWWGRHLCEACILLHDGMRQTERLPDRVCLHRWLLRFERRKVHLRLARRQLGAGHLTRACGTSIPVERHLDPRHLPLP